MKTIISLLEGVRKSVDVSTAKMALEEAIALLKEKDAAAQSAAVPIPPKPITPVVPTAQSAATKATAKTSTK